MIFYDSAERGHHELKRKPYDASFGVRNAERGALFRPWSHKVKRTVNWARAVTFATYLINVLEGFDRGGAEYSPRGATM